MAQLLPQMSSREFEKKMKNKHQNTIQQQQLDFEKVLSNAVHEMVEEMKEGPANITNRGDQVKERIRDVHK